MQDCNKAGPQPSKSDDNWYKWPGDEAKEVFFCGDDEDGKATYVLVQVQMDQRGPAAGISTWEPVEPIDNADGFVILKSDESGG